MRLWNWLPGIVALAGLAAGPAVAAEPIGAAVVVVNQVTAKLDDLRVLQQGDGVHQSEMIEVASDGSGELKLNDETKMALGPGAKLLLDKFVYDPNETKGTIAVNLAKGAFRFITGVAAKPNYVVRVPQASITVRGTIFDVYVQDNGVSWLLLHEGAVTICNERGRCRDLDEPGKLIRINDGGDVEPPTRWTKLPQKTNFDSAFPFVEKKPKDSPEVLTRDDIFIDIVLPPKKRKVRDPDPPKDRADTPKKRDKVKDRGDKKEATKPTRKRVAKKNRGDDDDDSQIMDGMGVAIGIAGGIRIGGGGRKRGGGDGGYRGPTGGGRHPR